LANRRPLIEGVTSPTPPVDAEKERAFVFQDRAPMPAKASPSAAQHISRVPLTTRMRADLAAALKRASLERQLESIEPNTLQDILEEAVEPWLKANGYIS
jgi:hypothetical protein